MACKGCRKAKKKFSTNMKKVIASKKEDVVKPEIKSGRQIRAEIRAKRKIRRENRRLRQLRKLESQEQINIHKNQA